MKYLLLLSLLGLLCCTPKKRDASQEDDPVTLSERYQPLEKTARPNKSHYALGLSGYAKVICSAVFVSGRQPEEAFNNSGYFFMPEEDNSQVKWEIDYNDEVVSLYLGDSLEAKAKYHGDQGCIIQTGSGLKFDPVKVTSALPPAHSMPWPMGDNDASAEAQFVPEDSIQKSIKHAFREQALTAAFLVTYKGKILIEEYAPGIDLNTQLESWSMGKSLTATLIGRMIHKGYFALDDAAPVSAWKRKGDPRGQISIRNLLQMSSGLRFIAHRDPEVATYTQYLDHMFIYTGAVNAFRYSIERPLQYPVGTTGRYRNSDPLTLGYIFKTQLESRNLEYLTFPQEELFDKIGIRKQVLETDPYGNFLLTGYDYGTARNWARLGMLYLNDGMSNGERLLPEDWNDFVSTPAPAWEDPVYGGQFWLNQLETYPLPKSAYYMGGGGGQRTIIIPSHDMVVVRLGHFRGGRYSDEALSDALTVLMNVIPPN